MFHVAVFFEFVCISYKGWAAGKGRLWNTLCELFLWVILYRVPIHTYIHALICIFFRNFNKHSTVCNKESYVNIIYLKLDAASVIKEMKYCAVGNTPAGFSKLLIGYLTVEAPCQTLPDLFLNNFIL